jgi:hypothetical protein
MSLTKFSGCLIYIVFLQQGTTFATMQNWKMFCVLIMETSSTDNSGAE